MGKAKKQHLKEAQKESLGKKVLCIAMGGAIYQCQNKRCLTVKRKGMFLEYQAKLFCTELCIEESLN